MAYLRQKRTPPPPKQHLLDSFEKLQKLKALVFLPASRYHRWGFSLGPSGVLSLKTCRGLESISAFIDSFAFLEPRPAGESLTLAPMEALPGSLRSLHIVVDTRNLLSMEASIRIRTAWYQPRVAALGFLEDLANICPVAFPGLREVEYVWAATGIPKIIERLDCKSRGPRCCDMHERIRILSPHTDHTSEAEGTISPFQERFDNLTTSFKDVNVAFRVTELDKYSDYFFHWRRDGR